MANFFRLLRADEIEARISTVGKKGISLLLYKDARVDMNILDEAAGPMNWKKEYSRDNANCTVSIWDPEKNQWIGKEDTGTESFTEKEKGLASDSFKRACFNWGIGRELYTAPFIWIFPDKCNLIEKDGKWTCYDRFEVREIGYDAAQRICRLVIGNQKTHEIVYEYGELPETINYAQQADLRRTFIKFGIEEAYILESLKKEHLEQLSGSEYNMINSNISTIASRCEAWKKKRELSA